RSASMSENERQCSVGQYLTRRLKQADFRHYFTVPIAAFFLQVGRGSVGTLGRFDHSIDYPLHPIGCGRPELSLAGLLVPWTAILGALDFLAAWLPAAILDRPNSSSLVFCPWR